MNDLSSEQRQQLIEAAIAVRQHAFAPYSQFAVGAALWADNDQLYRGCNVENASYGLTICAERAAAFQAIAAGARRLRAIAVASSGPATPCGACRQVLAEFADDLLVLLVDPADPTRITELTLRALLPYRFESQT